MKPSANQTIRRIQVSSGKPTIIPTQTKIPRIGTSGTSGVLNGRGASGIVLRITIIPIQTKTKANKVPILVISPTIRAGTKAANKPTKMKKRTFDFQGVLNFGCTSANTFGNKPSADIE